MLFSFITDNIFTVSFIIYEILQISAHIEAKQLKSAYLLAVKYKRITDIRRIMSEAELLNQPTIKSLCQRILQQGHMFRSKHSQ